MGSAGLSVYNARDLYFVQLRPLGRERLFQMTIELILLTALVALTLYGNGVHAYIHFNSYPLFAHVGKPEFPAYLGAWEKGLNIPLMLPYVFTLLVNIALIFVRPADVPVVGVIGVLLTMVVTAVVSVGLATPVYARIKKAGEAAAADLAALMRINLYRLGLATLASVIVLGLLLGQLSA